MTHNLGRVVTVNKTITESAGLDFSPTDGPDGPVRFVILNFDNVSLNGSAELTVDLGYATDVFRVGDGPSFWTRPADKKSGPIKIRISGGTGTARLAKYGSGEPTKTANPPGTFEGSWSNPDVFLHTDPYEEPTYETRLECHPGFAWTEAQCPLPPITDAIRQKVAASVGIIVEVDPGNVSSCSGTLIGPDLFLTARHCLTDPQGEDVRSASVTFDYETDCQKHKIHNTRFFKVIEEVASGVAATGTENIATDQDWVVVRIDAAPGALPSPLQMRSAALMTGEQIFTMHHPNGAIKKTQTGTFAGGDTIHGFDYAGGSSGSALFDSTGKLVGGPLSKGPWPTACDVAYAPIANVIAGLATPPPPPAPLDVMIVFDRSGSMTDAAPPSGRTKLQEAQDAAALFVQLVREGAGDRLGLVSFSSNATTDRSPIAAASAKPALVGPAPFNGGIVAGITAGGSTSIGDGLDSALTAFSTGSGMNADRRMLLMTDGLQNTPKMISDVEGSIGAAKVNIVGFGSDADIDGTLLTRLAHDHGGHFTRALDGLSLRKFFGLSFGNIFESGALTDPDRILHANQPVSETHKFNVCGEERITVVLGWDSVATPLRAHIKTPSGKPLDTKHATEVRGLTWLFWRIPLPHDGERDGTWTFTVDRVPSHVEISPPPTDVRYFFLVVCAGGPKFVPLPPPKHVYTGDPLNLMVALHYRNRTVPPDAKVEVIIERPGIALGQLTTQAGLSPPSPSGDPVDAFHATLKAIAKKNGGVLPVATSIITVPLYDDALHSDGAMEPDGIFNNPIKDLTRVEGTYHFRAVATYGESCRASREAIWSVHVQPGIHPGRSTVTVVDVTGGPGGNHGTLVITPHDVYGNPLGPGRGGSFTVSPMPGVTVTGKPQDRGDGSYGIGITWTDPATPGVVVQQPGRDPVPLVPPPATVPPGPRPDCNDAAGKLLDCLGLDNPDVKCVRVKSVNIEIDLKEPKCPPDPKCRPKPKGSGC